MKTTAYSILAAIVLTLTSCDFWDHHIVPSSSVSTAEYTYDDYNAINASHAFRVYVSFSDAEESIEIEANDNLHQYIEVRKENNALYIGLRNDIHVTGSPTLKAYITTRKVTTFNGSGATKFQLNDPVESENAAIYLSGASTFLGELTVNDLRARLSGASSAQLSGSAKTLDVEASGASSIRDTDFSVEVLQADLSGASSAILAVSNELEVKASGASHLKYKGSPSVVYKDLSGSSSVSKIN